MEITLSNGLLEREEGGRCQPRGSDDSVYPSLTRLKLLKFRVIIPRCHPEWWPSTASPKRYFSSYPFMIIFKQSKTKVFVCVRGDRNYGVFVKNKVILRGGQKIVSRENYSFRGRKMRRRLIVMSLLRWRHDTWNVIREGCNKTVWNLLEISWKHEMLSKRGLGILNVERRSRINCQTLVQLKNQVIYYKYTPFWFWTRSDIIY